MNFSLTKAGKLATSEEFSLVAAFKFGNFHNIGLQSTIRFINSHPTVIKLTTVLNASGLFLMTSIASRRSSSAETIVFVVSELKSTLIKNMSRFSASLHRSDDVEMLRVGAHFGAHVRDKSRGP